MWVPVIGLTVAAAAVSLQAGPLDAATVPRAVVASPVSALPAPGPTASAPSLAPVVQAVPEPSATTTPNGPAIQVATSSFAQDTYSDPDIKGAVRGSAGVRVSAQVWTGWEWVEKTSVTTASDGRFSVRLHFGNGELRTDRWRLRSGEAVSAEITVKRLGVVRAVSRPVTRADLRSTWHDGCPVHYSDLRLLEVSHLGFDGHLHRGRLVVHKTAVGKFGTLMQKALDERFPIAKMQTLETYAGDDDASMAANNTSTFNCRLTVGGSRWSDHSFGTAIDINPVQNPYVDGEILPPAGKAYLNRSDARPGMLTARSPLVTYARAAGWAWLTYDYQHLELPRP
ncbi:MAG TPA: hypothetical protein DEH05_05985 [Propionibacteriaceae bacterium]|nr:hypothetical protein [Propionibacteriaceae bacterium]